MDIERARAVADALAADETEAAAPLFREAGAPAPRVTIAPDPAHLDEPRLAALYHHWAGLPRATHGLPVSEAFDARDIDALLPFVALLDVLADGEDYGYRHYGRDIASSRGRDFTGLRVSELPIPAHIRTFFAAIYMTASRRGTAILTEHSPPHEVSVADWRRLVLPLIGASGRVDTILAGVVAGAWRGHAAGAPGAAG